MTVPLIYVNAVTGSRDTLKVAAPGQFYRVDQSAKVNSLNM